MRRPAARALLAVAALLSCAAIVRADATAAAAEAEAFFARAADGNASEHTSNWAVLVCSSRYWFNYRHVANALSIYRTVKRLGIPDSHIILMLADDVACNARNAFPARVFNDVGRGLDLYGQAIEVDYRGYDVSVENFLRVLTGRHEAWVPRSKRLLSDARSNVLIYMTGHGGDEFLKFQDQVEITSNDIADALAQMAEKRRYKEVLFIADTCQAVTLAKHFYAPGVAAIGSSALGEPSWSHVADPAVGLSLIDRFTHYALQFLERVTPGGRGSLAAGGAATVGALMDSLDARLLQSTPTARADLLRRPLRDVRVTDFFGGVTRVTPTMEAYPGFVGGGDDGAADAAPSEAPAADGVGGEAALLSDADASARAADATVQAPAAPRRTAPDEL